MPCVTCGTNMNVSDRQIVAFLPDGSSAILYTSCDQCFAAQGGFCGRCNEERVLYASPKNEQRDPASLLVLGIQSVCEHCCEDQAIRMEEAEGKKLLAFAYQCLSKNFLSTLAQIIPLHQNKFGPTSWRGELLALYFAAAACGKTPEQFLVDISGHANHTVSRTQSLQ